MEVVVAYDEGLAQRVREALSERPDFTGRSLKGMVYVAVDGIADDAHLSSWLDIAVSFAGGLPPK